MSVVSNNILAGASGQGGAGYAIERSLRFNSGDSSFLNRTPSAAGNRKTWTWSNWIKKSGTGSKAIISSHGPSDPSTYIGFSSDYLWIFDFNGGFNVQLISTAIFRDQSAWYHIVVVADTTQGTAANRLKAYVNGTEITSWSTSTYPTQNYEFDLNSSTEHRIGTHTTGYYLDGYLADVHFIDGQALAETDFGELDDNNVWQPKAFAGTYGTNGFHLDFADNSSNAAIGTDTSGNSNDWTVNNLTANAVDYTPQAVLTGSLYSGAGGVDKIFDGTTATCGPSDGSYVTFTPSTPIPITSSFRIRANVSNASNDANFAINGSDVSTVSTGFPAAGGIVNAASTWTTITGYTQLTSLKFGWSGSWMSVSGIEIDGVVLISSPTSDIDSLVDTPTNGDTASDTGAGGEVVGNYATLNPLRSDLTLTNGNLDSAGTSGWTGAAGTIGMSSGKWYWEIDNVQSNEHVVGIVKGDVNQITWNTTYGYGAESGTFYPAAGGSSYGAAWTTGDVIGIAFDADNGSLTFYKNGVSQNVAATGLTDGPYFPSVVHNGSSRTSSINFGQRAFAYTAPSGYKALCTSNLPEPTIADGSKYFDTKLWDGNNSTQAITGLNFSPDFLWAKARNNTNWHELYDTVRGNSLRLFSNEPNADDGTSGLNSFDSNGFTLNNASGINATSSTNVGWAWDAGSSNTTIAAGSLNSSAYNQSQSAWENYLTTTNGNGFPDPNYPVTWAFDGHLNHHTYTGDDDIYFTPSGSVSFTITNQVRIRSYLDTTVTVETSAGTFGPVTSSNSGSWQWTTVTCSGTLTKITIRRVNGANLSGIEIDGILLINSGITPPNVPSIASTVRANPSAGFSIVSYTGTQTSAGNGTIGHGLNAQPALVISKDRDNATPWIVQNTSLGSNEYLTLNDTAAASNSSSAGAGSLPKPTSSVFYGSWLSGLNTNGADFIAYCFAPVEGYSAIGSYTGNGNADGPFVYTGFKPAFIMFKRSSSTGNWYIYDTARDEFNSTGYRIYPNLSNGGATSNTNAIDILSNGFKLTSGAAGLNASSGSFTYATFAEHPFKTARAR